MYTLYILDPFGNLNMFLIEMGTKLSSPLHPNLYVWHHRCYVFPPLPSRLLLLPLAGTCYLSPLHWATGLFRQEQDFPSPPHLAAFHSEEAPCVPVWMKWANRFIPISISIQWGQLPHHQSISLLLLSIIGC